MTSAQNDHIRAKIRADIRPYPGGVFVSSRPVRRVPPPPGIVLREVRGDMLAQFKPAKRGKYYLGRPLASNDRLTKSKR